MYNCLNDEQELLNTTFRHVLCLPKYLTKIVVFVRSDCSSNFIKGMAPGSMFHTQLLVGSCINV